MPKLTSQFILPLFLTVVLLASCQRTPSIKPNPVKIDPPQPLIVIDAGHQAQGDSAEEPLYPGSDQFKAKVSSGTSGVVTKIPEHEINLRVALELEERLQHAGFRVIMVRRQAFVNISNRERAELANRANADLFLRLHCDYSSNPKVSGVGLFYPAKKREVVAGTQALSLNAVKVMATTFEAAGFTVHKPQPREDLTGFNWSNVPTVLVEMGYMSNPQEDQLLAEPPYEEKLAQVMSEAIAAIFSKEVRK